MIDLNHVFYAGEGRGAHCGHRRVFTPPVPAVASRIIQDRPSRSHPAGVEPGTDEFLDQVLNSAGLCPRTYHRHTLYRRIPSCLRFLRAPGVSRAREMLEREPALTHGVLEVLLIGVTEFFRDEEVFAVLRSAVLPHLLESRQHLRVWSLGCSEGQELYSVAILLRELGVDLRTVELLGSDMRAGAVQRAAAGRYTETEMHGVPPEWLARYFQKESHGYRVVEEVRSNVRWRRSNAVAWESPPTHWHLILYRNLAIYLAPEAAAWTWAHLAERVSLGGVLVTGKAERPPQGLRLRRLSPCVYYRPEGHA